jgi:outer membrane protein assembly factor BamB
VRASTRLAAIAIMVLAALVGATPFAGADRAREPRLIVSKATDAPRVWTRDLGGEVVFAPVLAGDAVVVVSAADVNFTRTNVHVLELATGEVRWEQDSFGAAVDATPVVAGDILLLLLRDQRLVAVNLADGTLRWSARTGRNVKGPPPPIVAQSTVYLGSQDGLVQAFHLDDGFGRWSKSLPHAVLASPSYATGFLYLGTGTLPLWPTSRGLLCYIEGTIASISGCQPAGAPIMTTPVGRKGVLAASTHPFDEDQSAALVVEGARITVPGRLTSPVLLGTLLAVASNTGMVQARDLADGNRKVWQVHVGASQEASLSRAGDGLVVAGRELAVLALDTGTRRWRVAFPDAFLGTSRDPRRIVAISRTGVLGVFDTMTGDVLIDEELHDTPVGATLSAGTLVWATRSGQVNAIRVPTATGVTLHDCPGTKMDEGNVTSGRSSEAFVRGVVARGAYYRESYANVTDVSVEPWSTQALDGFQIVVELGHETDCPSAGSWWEGAPTRYVYPG